MKKYIQLTAGRGPVECARAVALVAKEMLREYPSLLIIDYEPHHSEPDCYMSVTFSVEGDVSLMEDIGRKWVGTVLYRSTANRYRPGHKRKNWFVGVSMADPLMFYLVFDKYI